jgi:hypothetical protein
MLIGGAPSKRLSHFAFFFKVEIFSALDYGKIIIIDDEPAMVTEIVVTLSREGHEDFLCLARKPSSNSTHSTANCHRRYQDGNMSGFDVCASRARTSSPDIGDSDYGIRVSRHCGQA